MLRTVLLLTASNIFMTFAWYGNLKNSNLPIWKLVLISWGIAFFEYCFMIPANKFGFANGINGFQLKIIQEVIILVVFAVFVVLCLKEPFYRKYLVSFALIPGAVYFAFKKLHYCMHRLFFIKSVCLSFRCLQKKRPSLFLLFGKHENLLCLSMPRYCHHQCCNQYRLIHN